MQRFGGFVILSAVAPLLFARTAWCVVFQAGTRDGQGEDSTATVVKFGDLEARRDYLFADGQMYDLEARAEVNVSESIEEGVAGHSANSAGFNTSEESVYRSKTRHTIHHRGKVELSVACTKNMRTSDPQVRTILLTLVPPFHGSTALEGYLMSSNSLSSLCKANTWECEGSRVMQLEGYDPHNWTKWDFNVMLNSYSRVWDLDRPVLFDKSPAAFRFTQQQHAGLRQALLPKSMQQAGVQQLNVTYILMWRPTCLAALSSHAKQRDRGWAFQEMKLLETQVRAHRYLRKQGVPIIVVSMADLIWRPSRTTKRMRHFMPCLGKLDADFEPTLGKEVLPSNMWKARGSVKTFGMQVDPHSLGYNLPRNTCVDMHTEPGFDRLSDVSQDRLERAVKYLSGFS